ncbi:MAG TPA: tetratricopeptide repeat protein, partial [Usitatibacter sp.]|nr:tetratricopeptide repeat protein [Usitatibacter sp.]
MPAEAARAVSEGNRLRKEGRLAEAVSAYRRAVALSPEAGDAHYNLGIALREAGELREAALEFRAAARLDPRDMDAVQNVVETLARAAERGARLFPAVAAAPPPSAAPFSIVVCSAHDDRLARMQASFRAALAGRDHEFVVIRDARSLSEGYQRGLAAARHERVVLCHDDVELASADPFAALQRALEGHNIVGLAG